LTAAAFFSISDFAFHYRKRLMLVGARNNGRLMTQISRSRLFCLIVLKMNVIACFRGVPDSVMVGPLETVAVELTVFNFCTAVESVEIDLEERW
jgi:hypothetical protein